jgi:hypothetical protein
MEGENEGDPAALKKMETIKILLFGQTTHGQLRIAQQLKSGTATGEGAGMTPHSPNKGGEGDCTEPEKGPTVNEREFNIDGQLLRVIFYSFRLPPLRWSPFSLLEACPPSLCLGSPSFFLLLL